MLSEFTRHEITLMIVYLYVSNDTLESAHYLNCIVLQRRVILFKNFHTSLSLLIVIYYQRKEKKEKKYILFIDLYDKENL